MSDIDLSRMMADLKRLSQQAQASANAPQQTPAEAINNGHDTFSDLLQQAVNNVNDTQKNASDLKKAFEVGDVNVDLPQVMVASQKAGIAFSALVEVRNKLLEAYKDVMSMPV